MNQSLLFGDNLFETVRIVSGQPQRLQRHIARFTESAAVLGYPSSEIESGVKGLHSLEGREDGLWRATFVRSSDIFGDWESQVLFHHRPSTTRPRPRLTCISGYVPEDRTAELKTTSYLRSMMARRSAVAAGFDDGLMVSRGQTLGESSMANVFLVINDGLVTPAIEGILPGTTRAAILENARLGGLHIDVRTVHQQELSDASEIILTSAGILAVSALSLDDRVLDQHWGPVLGELACA